MPILLIFSLLNPHSVVEHLLFLQSSAVTEVMKKKISHRLRSAAWKLIPLFGPLSRRGLNPIKPVYDPDWPAQFDSQRL